MLLITTLTRRETFCEPCCLVLMHGLGNLLPDCPGFPHRRYTEVCGFHGMLAGCLVALKQIQPDSGVTLFVYIKFRAKVCTSLLATCVQDSDRLLLHGCFCIPYSPFLKGSVVKSVVLWYWSTTKLLACITLTLGLLCSICPSSFAAWPRWPP